MSEPLRIGVLVSGSGTNLQAIMDGCDAGEIDGQVVVVVSNKAEAFGLERARRAGVAAFHVDPQGHGDFSGYNAEIARVMGEHDVGLVVMAGYMRLLGAEVLDAFPDRVLNIHPALLPSFPGAHGIQDAWDAGVKVTGVTVHFANDVFDEGPIIAQEAVRVEEDDTIETLEEKIHEVEYRIYSEAIQAFAQGRLERTDRGIMILPT